MSSSGFTPDNKLIIFDLDGTLYKTDDVSLEAIQKAMDELGFKVPDEDFILSLIGDKMEEICQALIEGQENGDVEKLIKRIRYYEWEFIPEKAGLFPGIEDVLDELIDSNYILAICSNGHPEYIDKVLKSTDVEEKFRHVRGREGSRTKSEIIREIIDKSEADYSILVGDRIHDYRAASSNMIPGVGVAYGYGGEELKEADYIAEEPHDILKITRRCEIYSVIEKKIKENVNETPAIIGINGIDCSGKTEFSSELQKYLRIRGIKNELVHLDDFHNPTRIRYSEDNPVDSYIHNAFDFDKLIKEILKPYAGGEKINKELELLDLKTDEFQKKKKFNIDSDSLLIVEGTLLYREPLDDFFDFRIFLDVDFERAMERAEDRDKERFDKCVREKYTEKYIPVQKWYLKKYKPKKKSHLTVNNNDFDQPEITGIEG